MASTQEATKEPYRTALIALIAQMSKWTNIWKLSRLNIPQFTKPLRVAKIIKQTLLREFGFITMQE
jgi:hypothetical protein